MTQPLDFTIVLPVYYNEESLLPAFEDLKRVLLDLRPACRGQLLYVDDGSGDRSFDVLLQLRQQTNIPVTVLKLSRNFGQVMAIRAGIAHASTPYVIAMSADGQEPADLVAQMLRAVQEQDAEVVVCTRSDRDESAYRKWTSHVFYRAMRRFCFRDMHCIFFSLLIAASLVSKLSRWTISTGRRDLVYFAPFPELCAFSLCSGSVVHPV